MQFALVYLVTVAIHQLVHPNVFRIKNAHRIKLASICNVLTRALEVFVVLVPVVRSFITIQFVRVR